MLNYGKLMFIFIDFYYEVGNAFSSCHGFLLLSNFVHIELLAHHFGESHFINLLEEVGWD